MRPLDSLITGQGLYPCVNTVGRQAETEKVRYTRECLRARFTCRYALLFFPFSLSEMALSISRGAGVGPFCLASRFSTFRWGTGSAARARARTCTAINRNNRRVYMSRFPAFAFCSFSYRRRFPTLRRTEFSIGLADKSVISACALYASYRDHLPFPDCFVSSAHGIRVLLRRVSWNFILSRLRSDIILPRTWCGDN